MNAVTITNTIIENSVEAALYDIARAMGFTVRDFDGNGAMAANNGLKCFNAEGFPFVFNPRSDSNMATLVAAHFMLGVKWSEKQVTVTYENGPRVELLSEAHDGTKNSMMRATRNVIVNTAAKIVGTV